MESHQMQQIEQMKNNLKELLKQLKNAGEKYQLLEQIIQININMENKTNSHRNIQESLINSLHVNPFLLLSLHHCL